MKLSAAQITQEQGACRVSRDVADAARLRLLADLSRDLRRPLDERGVWEAGLRRAAPFCGADRGWGLDLRGRVLLGRGAPPPELHDWLAQGAQARHTEEPRPETPHPVDAAEPWTEARPLATGAALRVPVSAGARVLGSLVLTGPELRDLGPEDRTALDVLGAQVGAAAQLLRLSAELARSVRPPLLRRAALRARAGRLSPDGALLTTREREVLTLVSRGLSNPEIGAALGIRAGTAKIHVERILSKLGVADRMGAAALGLSLGLIDA